MKQMRKLITETRYHFDLVIHREITFLSVVDYYLEWSKKGYTEERHIRGDDVILLVQRYPNFRSSPYFTATWKTWVTCASEEELFNLCEAVIDLENVSFPLVANAGEQTIIFSRDLITGVENYHRVLHKIDVFDDKWSTTFEEKQKVKEFFQRLKRILNELCVLPN